jgi:hypothetical protein
MDKKEGLTLTQRFCELQRECRFVGTDGEVSIPTRHYQFVTLLKLRVDILHPLFVKYHFGFTQPLTVIDGNNALLTKIFDDETGEVVAESSVILKTRSENNPQDWGSAITYFRRYSLFSLLGMVGDKDDDCYIQEDEIKSRVSETINIKDLNKLYISLRKEQQEEYKDIFSKKKKELQKNIVDSTKIQ